MNRGTAALPLVVAVMAALLGVACSSPAGSPAATAPPANPAPAGQGAIVTIGPAASGSTIQIRDDSKLGKILTDATGKTLYRYDADAKGASNCTGGCTQTWQPLLLPSGAPTGPSGLSGLSTLSRADGGRQVMYNDEPLYRFAGDTQPNDAKGDSPSGPWHVVHPS
ncbi:MAG TPA: hypothetical protein VGK54_11745 [Chloroflexota bacterium]